MGKNVFLIKTFFSVLTEPRKEKTDANAGGNALSPSIEQQCSGPLPPGNGNSGNGDNNKPERPNSLGPTKLSRRIIFCHGDHCKFINKNI